MVGNNNPFQYINKENLQVMRSTSKTVRMSPSFVLLLTCCIGLAVASDVVTYDISTQPTCTEYTRGPSRDCRWPAGLDMVDQIIKGGRIAAYKIRWFSGKWSGWYVPGVNDLGAKVNLYARKCSVAYKANTMRRRWASFYDHTHTFILCKPKT